jgi:hypothetical protein
MQQLTSKKFLIILFFIGFATLYISFSFYPTNKKLYVPKIDLFAGLNLPVFNDNISEINDEINDDEINLSSTKSSLLYTSNSNATVFNLLNKTLLDRAMSYVNSYGVNISNLTTIENKTVLENFSITKSNGLNISNLTTVSIG